MLVKTLSYLLLSAILAFAGCTSKDRNTIRIGAILPMTGNAATLGKWGAAGIEMAVDDINNSGGINGKMLLLTIDDSGGEPAKAVSALRKMLATEKPEVIFSIVTAVDLSLVAIAEQENVILFSHASHPDITKSRGLVLRHSNTVDQEAGLIVSSLDSMHAPRAVSLLYLNDDYGTAFASQIIERIRLKLPHTILNQVSFNRDETSFISQVTKSLESKPTVVIVAGVGRSTGIAVRRLKEQGFRGRIIATLAFLATDGQVAAGEAANGVWCVEFVPPRQDETASLKERYKNRTDEDVLPMGVVIFYNSLRLWATARDRYSGPTPGEIVSAIKQIKEFSGVGESMSITSSGDILPRVHLIQYWK
jgi:branched-chain amino acid transport system substrate-binding protein